MKMFEAIEVARKTGKPILCVNAGLEALWCYGELVWRNGTEIALSPKHLDSDWRVVEPESKEYDFDEAFKMMKEGKWMQCVNNPAMTLKACDFGWIRHNARAITALLFSVNEINSKWIEVLP